MIIPRYALEDRELWTPVLVRNALVRALRVMRAIPGSVGPRGDKAFWLDIASEPGEADEEPERLRPKRDDITKAEIVLVGFTDTNGRQHPAWLNGALLGYPQQRTSLARWAKWASYGKMSSDGLPETDDDFAKRLRLSPATFKRQKDFAAMIVAVALNEADLTVWHVEAPPRRNRQSAGSDA